MKFIGQIKPTIGCGALCAIVGIILTAYMFLGSSYPTYLPFILAALGVLILLYGLASAALPDRNWFAHIKKQNFTILLLVLASGYVYLLFNFGRKHIVHHQMTWSIHDAYEPITPAIKTVEMRFVETPCYHSTIDSSELPKCLQQHNKNPVDVAFEVTTDFGKTRGFNEIKIGECVNWDASNGGFGFSGSASCPDGMASPIK